MIKHIIKQALKYRLDTEIDPFAKLSNACKEKTTFWSTAVKLKLSSLSDPSVLVSGRTGTLSNVAHVQ